MSHLVPTLASAAGHGRYWRHSAKIIRFARQGCTNRPFYQIVVMEVNNRISILMSLSFSWKKSDD